MSLDEIYSTREAHRYSFIRWRVGLMEMGIARLGIEDASESISDNLGTPDTYRMIQVHDYLNISFLRMDPTVRAASKKVIELFQKYYPETMTRKFFVNVPVIMGWMYGAMRLMMNKDTAKKLTMLSYGDTLVKELGDSVPEVYGGKGKPLEAEGETLKTE